MYNSDKSDSAFCEMKNSRTVIESEAAVSQTGISSARKYTERATTVAGRGSQASETLPLNLRRLAVSVRHAFALRCFSANSSSRGTACAAVCGCSNVAAR